MIDFQLTKRRLREYGQGRAKAASSLVRPTGVCPGGRGRASDHYA
jgi:hypothetical protein